MQGLLSKLGHPFSEAKDGSFETTLIKGGPNLELTAPVVGCWGCIRGTVRDLKGF